MDEAISRIPVTKVARPNHFNLKQIFECGQCFRFNQVGEDEFFGIARGKALKLKQTDNEIILYGATAEDYESIWKEFLSIDEDYERFIGAVSTDEIVKKAIEFGSGIRIIKQELWECLISFIISQNNNIPRIKKIIEALCEHYGEAILFEDKVYHAFPTPIALSEVGIEELHALGCGYRDEYIALTAKACSSGEFDLLKLKELETKEAREKLLSLKGIGGKVADCILLFGMQRYEVCPHDVWVKRIFHEAYNIEKVNEKTGYALAESKWGNYAGIAQQYLFYAFREKEKK